MTFSDLVEGTLPGLGWMKVLAGVLRELAQTPSGRWPLVAGRVSPGSGWIATLLRELAQTFSGRWPLVAGRVSPGSRWVATLLRELAQTSSGGWPLVAGRVSPGSWMMCHVAERVSSCGRWMDGVDWFANRGCYVMLVWW
jgi:hypothetical protein